MDISTIGGLGLGVVMIVGSIIVGGTPLVLYWDLTSVMITIFGSFGALMVANPLRRILALMKYINHTLKEPKYEYEKVISSLVNFSEKARREGLLALEDDLDEVDQEFMRAGIQLVVDGTDPEVIRSILYTDLNQIQERHQDGIKLVSDWAALCPAFGMIGTLIGLIAMMQNLGGDASAIGKGMGTALLTTMYGSILANLVFLPFKSKLEDRDKKESLMMEIMIEGILSIQSGDNPRILEQKLLSFVPPGQRDAIRAESAAD